MARTRTANARAARARSAARSDRLRRAGGWRLGPALARLGGVLGEGAVWTLLLLLWWVHDIGAKDAFRLPKLVLAEVLVLASLALLSLRLQAVGRVGWRQLASLPALRAVLPLLLAGAISVAAGDHPLHGRAALISFAIGAAALVGWSAGFERPALERLLGGMLLPGVALSVVGVLQYYGFFRPFDFAGEIEAQRLGVTSYAGSAGDLSVALVLPCLIAQHRLIAGRGRMRLVWAAGLAVCLLALAVTQTLTSVLALALGSLVLWLSILSRRRALAVLAALLVVGGLLLALVTPLRERVGAKGRQLARGKVNHVLTGRLDGWRAAGWMLAEHPLTGVGLGAYRAEFALAKLALLEEGTEFLESQTQPMFANAHNEPLEVAAESGLIGTAALLWGLWVLLGRLRRGFAAGGPQQAAPAGPGAGADRALALAGVLALLLLSLGQFPFRLALTAYPAVLFLAWIFAPRSRPEVVS